MVDRPASLNALDLDMFETFGRTLAAWQRDTEISAVVVRGNGRAFSAGGDISAVRRAALAGDDAHNDRLYRTEYSLNALIAGYPKPYVALVHGYCMGGGLGIAIHGSQRVVAADAVLAMPETAIGFFPDIGASHLLAQLPGGLGLYLGLTGARLSAADALATGFATHYAGSRALSDIALAIVDAAAIGPALARYASPPPAAALDGTRAAIEHCFAAPSLLEIVARLDGDHSPWGAATRERLRAASPTSVALTFAMIRQARSLDLLTSLRIEYVLAKQMWRRPEFWEGVRAMVVDKDRTPAWQPARIEDVDLPPSTPNSPPQRTASCATTMRGIGSTPQCSTAQGSEFRYT
ncbi:MAG: enoyl-CoA hydratase/isomerase family protein [Vulcanimicrobiaceae bacterium]